MKKAYTIPLFLFILTSFTTILAGAIQQGINPFKEPASIIKGIPFSFTLMTILLTHESGHYIATRIHGMKATLPFFIPGPSIIGTFGAFIKIKSPISNKRMLIDIGSAGPIAGFVISVIAVGIGLILSDVVKKGTTGGIELGTPLIFYILSKVFVNIPSEEYDILLHPVAFAGWIGLFVTSLNLLPIGQLDGGHIVYALFGERHKAISVIMVFLLITLGFLGWPGWYLWAFLATILGFKHPPIIDNHIELDKVRKVIGWITLFIFILTFIPSPFEIP
ncbi:MAG: site-2 protease family protein [Nitrospirota bacterium]